MFKARWAKIWVMLFALLFLSYYVLPADTFARVGGGFSSGSRGSRSYSAPSRPAPSSPSSTPYRSYQPTPPPSQPSGGGFFRSFAGGMAGGLIGGMLFRSLGFGGMGGGFGGGGIGLFEIILMAAIAFFIYRFVKRRREQAAESAYYQSSSQVSDPAYQTSYDPGYAAQPQGGGMDLEKGLGYIRQMDPYFDEQRFKDACMDNFFKIQGGWAVRDMSGVRNLLTSEMYGIIQKDADRLKAEKKFNKLDNIAVRTLDIVEAWQETGQDFITVRFLANLLDYTVDEATGQVVSGSKTDPVKFEEYWTFTRPVGNNPWQLSAITQPE